MRFQRGTTFFEVFTVLAAPAFLLGWTTRTAPAPFSPTSIEFFRLAADAVGCTGTPRVVVVEASSTSFGFEVDCVPGGSSSSDRLASYDPSLASARPIARTESTLDTVTFFFQPDSSTARTDDFVLMRRINDEPAAAERRNLLVYPGRSFLHYFYREAAGKDAQPVSKIVPAEWLPLSHVAAPHGSSADVGIAALIDTLYAVEVNFSVVNSWDKVVTPSSTVIPLMSLRRDRLCRDDDPIYSHTSAFLSSSGLVPAAARAPRQVCA